MVKRIRTLLTLFLLVVGTGMSWAAFTDFNLNFTKSWANSTVINQGNDTYVVGFTGDVPTLTTTKPASYMACISGMKYHGNSYGIYAGAIKVPVVAGKYEIGLGITDYGGNVNVYAGEKQLAVINSKSTNGDKFFQDASKIKTGVVNVKSDCELTFTVQESDLGNVYYPYFSIKRIGDYEQPTNVKVTYYNTNGVVLGTEMVESGSALTFKYNESNVTVPAGYKFRGWFNSAGENSEKVKESIVVNDDLNLYAKATLIEEITKTSSFTYDLTNKYWYPEDHEAIDFSASGPYWHDNQHGWAFHNGEAIEIKVAGDAIITVDRCFFGANTTLTLTNGSKVIGTATAPVDVDGESASFKYVGGEATLTLKFTSLGGETYIHKISIEHIYTIAFEPFKIDFRSNPYTVVVPEDGKLPACVKSIEGKWHDAQHGYYDKVGATVSVDRPVKFYIGGCSQSHSNATVSVNGGAPEEIATMTSTCDNSKSYDVYATYIYKGTESAILKFTLGEYCPYIIAEEWSDLEFDEATKTFNVAAGNTNMLKEAIKEANAMGGNVTIYLPNGTYDFGTDINTEIKANNIAIIGESRDGVIIKNSPAEEGLDKTATLKNTSTGLYLQDVTIQCYAPYNATAQAERGVALWDKGTKTICKNVYLKGKQDVYYSNGAEGMIAYFEGGKIEGGVDFLCGSGNVLFNSVTLNVVSGTNSGNIIAAPSTYTSENGYVFANCLVTGNSNYYLARGWKAHEQASSAATFIATNMMSAPNSAYWGATMGEGMTRRFSAFDASGNVVKIDAAVKPEIITKASLVAFAGSWDPAAIISQHSPIKTNAKGWASYTAFTDVYLSGAKAYVAIKINEHSVLLRSITNIPAGTPVFIKGEDNSKYYVSGALSAKKPETNYLRPVLFDTQLTAANKAYVLGTKNGQPGLYKVGSNVKIPAGKCYLYVGGASFSLDGKEMLELVIDEAETTGIDGFVAEEDADATRYNLAGQKVGKGYKGIVVCKGGKKYLAK